MGNEQSSLSNGLPGTFPITHQQQEVAHFQPVVYDVHGRRIPSNEQYRPCSVGVLPRRVSRPISPQETHTPPGSPVYLFNSSSRSPDAPRLNEALSLSKDFQLQRVLGDSSEGAVYLAKHNRNGKFVAMKILHRKARSRDISELSEDCLFHLRKIPYHRHILFMSQVDITSDAQIWQCLSFCNAGDLLDYGERIRDHTLSRDGQLIFVLHVFIQLGEALAFLHHGLSRDRITGRWTVATRYRSILHNDVKPDNIMLHFQTLNDFGMPDIRLGDFGAATLASSPPPCAGTPDYFSPEAKIYDEGFEGPPMQRASNVYTFGLTLHWLITGNRWAPAKPPKRLRLPREYEMMGFTRIIKNCLNLDPRLRPTMDCHPVSGLMQRVDCAYKERAQLHGGPGLLGYTFWVDWRQEAMKTEIGRTK